MSTTPHRHRRALARATAAALLAACALAPLARHGQPAAGEAGARDAAAVEMPTHWEGRPLRPMALSAVERRFAQQFPGSIDRMTDGTRVLVLREVREPTRMLHPAADCYRGLGYRIEQARLEHDAQQRLWRCFVAIRPGSATLRVCERITDGQGRAWTDTSAWFWAAASGNTAAPWQAVTLATPIGDGS